MVENSRTRLIAALAVIVVATIVAYLPVFDAQKEFTNWDDNLYVTDLPLVKSLSADSVAKMFSMSTSVASNYHPLTLLSLAINYEVVGESARGFAIGNLLLHVINALLVFFFLRRITSGNLLVAWMTSLWFAVHPMHVESVAWVSERKDVLYTLFLLISLISYVRFVSTRSYAWLAGSFVAFIASCLSKAMAVPLPIALFLIDYWYDRKLSIGTIGEKLPFLAVSVWLGIVAVQFQAGEAIAKFEVLTTAQRFAFAGYGFVMYWVKMIVPYDLSTFYPYPTTQSTGNISWWYFIMPAIAVSMIILPYIGLKKNFLARKYFVLGMGVYVLFVVLVLQFISVGQVVMAERYTYVPYIGSLLLLAYGVSELYIKRSRLATMFALVFTVALIPITYQQVGTWTNSATLWSRVINLYPYEFEQTGNTVVVTKVGAAVAYGARAAYLYDKNRIDEAFADLKVVETVNAKGWKLWQALGVIYGMKGQYSKSLECLTRALSENPGQPNILLNRGITYAFAQMPAEAVEDFTSALALGIAGKDRYQALSGKARESLRLGAYDACAETGAQTMKEFPNEFDGYFFRGTALINLKRPQEAISLLRKATSINANDASAWFNLAIAYRDTGDNVQRAVAARRAKERGFAVPESFLN
ncbi:MAG: hypothetical protein RLZZ273_1742 [Bacteroidota bacterium]|jgi:tetratricopeptide (TPR) repeat protein